MFFSCHIHVSRWIHILQLPKVHKTPCLKQVRNLKFKWLQLDLNSEPLSLSTNTKPFGQSGQMIELCSEYLSAQCIWLYVLVVSHICFRVSPRYSCLKVKEIFAWSKCKIWSLSDCNWTQTQKHLVQKQTLNHLAKLAKWLSCVLSTYLHGAFDRMFLSCHVCVSEWIHTL